MDNFETRLMLGMEAPDRKPLATQCQGRALTEQEATLAAALMSIYGEGILDFAKVAEELGKRGIVAPIGGTREWTEVSLSKELTVLNTELDAAYQVNGYGA